MDTKLYLFRELRDEEMRWSHVGPHHERLYFNLLELVGYAPVNRNDAAPYKIYDCYGWNGPKMPENSHPSLDAVKEAGRIYALEWLEKSGDGPVVWTPHKSGMHWEANADGILTPHCLRHAFATHVLERGGNIKDVADHMGHENINTTAGYIHGHMERVASPFEAMTVRETRPLPANVIAFQKTSPDVMAVREWKQQHHERSAA